MQPIQQFYQLDLMPPELAARKVGSNCHIAFEGSYYSVPHELIKSSVIVRAFRSFIDILDSNGKCVASHLRSFKKRSYVTIIDHMPPYYNSFFDGTCYDGAAFRKWARKIGDNTLRFIDALLSDKAVEEHAYKSCMAVLQFSKKFGARRLDSACAQALSNNTVNYQSIRKLLVK